MSTTTVPEPIIVSNNETYQDRWDFVNSSNQPIDLTGNTVRFGMRHSKSLSPSYGRKTELTATTLEAYINDNSVFVVIESDRLRELTPGMYDYEILFVAPSTNKKVKVRGMIDLREGIA